MPRRFLAFLLSFCLLIGSIPPASATPVQDDTLGSWTDTFAATTGSLASSAQAGINTASGAVTLTKNDGSGQFNVPYYSTGSVMSVTIAPVIFGHWNQLSFTSANSGSNVVTIRVYKSDGLTLVSDTDLPGNSAGFTTSPVDLSTIPYGSTIGQIKLKASFNSTNTNYTPSLNDWTVTWVENNGYSLNPAPATGPWSARGRNNRATNQMDGTFSPAYTPLWVNKQTASTQPYNLGREDNVFDGLLTASGDVVVGNKRSLATDPYAVITLDKTTGLIKTSFTLDSVPTTAGAKQTSPDVQAVTKDNTIYYSRRLDDGDGGTFASFGAIRNGQLLWSRYVNQWSGYSSWLSLDNSGSVIIRSGHGNTSKYTLTGSKLWEMGTDYWNWGGPLSIGPGNKIYLVGTLGSFRIRSTTGASLVSIDGGGIGTPIVDTDGSAFVSPGNLSHLSVTGATLWSKTFVGSIIQNAEALAMDQTYVYAPAESIDALYVINKTDGSIAKTIGNGASITSGPSRYRGAFEHVVVDHAGQTLFDAATGNDITLYSVNGTRNWSYTSPSGSGNPFGDASQWYESSGTGIIAFKPWTLSAAVDMSTVAAGSSLTITATTSMLTADPATGQANAVQAVFSDGAKVALHYDHADGNGNTIWTGTYAVPAGYVAEPYTATIEASDARVQTGTGTTFAVPAAGSNNTGLTTTVSYTVTRDSSTSSVAPSGGGGGGGGHRGTTPPTVSTSSHVSSVSSSSSSHSSPSTQPRNTPPTTPSFPQQHLTTLTTPTALRTAPSSSAPLIAHMLTGWQVTLDSSDGTWAAVHTMSGKQGYLLLSSFQTSPFSVTPVSSDASRIVGTSLRMHVDPFVSSPRVTTLSPDQVVILLAKQGDWAKVQYHSFIGWVVSRYLRK